MKIIQLIKCIQKKMEKDCIQPYAAYATLFVLVSLFPFMMFGITFLKNIPIQFIDMGIFLNDYIPHYVKPLVEQMMNEAYAAKSIYFKSITFLVTVYCASKGFYACLRGIDAVYGTQETRNIFQKYAISIFYVILFYFNMIIMMSCIVFGKKIFAVISNWIPYLAEKQKMVRSLRYFGILFFLILFFELVYMIVPNRKSKWKEELPGAVFTAIGWISFSHFFSFYIDNISDYTFMYGSLSTIVIFIMWIYILMLITFIGAEINIILQKWIALQYSFDELIKYIQK